MHSHLDLNNRRIRQFIEQFNTEEAYQRELQSALDELRKFIESGADLTDTVAALRKARWKLPTPPSVNAVGLWLETASSR
jgi:ribosomal protein S16